MFKAWKERRRLQELAKACENERRKLTDPDPLAKHNAAVALAELGDDSGAHLLGAWLRGSRREEYRREIESRWRNPDPNVAAVSLEGSRLLAQARRSKSWRPRSASSQPVQILNKTAERMRVVS